MMSVRDLWTSTQSKTDAEPETPAEAQESSLPRNVVAKVFFVALAAIVWVLYSVGKVLFYTAGVVLFLVISLIELVCELAVMPLVLVARLLGQSRWPVEIGRAGEHFGTRVAEDFAAAGELRDELVAQIQRGSLRDSESLVMGRRED